MKFVTSELLEQLHSDDVIFRRALNKECKRDSDKADDPSYYCACAMCGAEGKVRLALLGNFAHRLERS